MNFLQYITLVLLSLQPSYGDMEPWSERTGRIEIVAKAIDEASSKATCSDAYNVAGCERKWPGTKKELALLLVTKGYWESKFAKNVHEGKCRAYECDAQKVNGKVSHRARSLWQIQKTGLVSPEEYGKMRTSSQESTTLSAEVATRYLSIGMNKCKTIKGAISIYGGADSCNWKGAEGRYAFFKSLLGKSEEQFIAERAKQKLALEERLSRQEREENNSGKVRAAVKQSN